MTDAECVEFLRWALPRLGLRWEGFRKVRRQVCRRVRARISELGLPGLTEYRALLEEQPAEWVELDRCCRVTISRFYRDRGVFEALGGEVLPALAAEAGDEEVLRAWSVGCASGEEPYSLALLWQLEVAERFPDLTLEVLATDVDSTVLERAGRGCYQPSSLKEVPQYWLDRGFVRRGSEFCIRPEVKEAVTFMKADVRRGPPGELFHIVLCRNLVFTYFAPAVQVETLEVLERSLRPGGALILGSHERLPVEAETFEPWLPGERVYRRRRATR